MQLLAGTSGYLLQGVAGPLLSGEAPRGRDAALLRPAFRDGRDQQHLLPHAGGVDAHALVGRGARELRVHAQGSAPDHAREALARGRVGRGRVRAARNRAGQQAWRAAVPVAAAHEEGPSSAAGLSWFAAARQAHRLRVSPRLVAGRRSIRDASRRMARCSASPIRTKAIRRSFRLRITATSACGERTTTTPI